MKLKVFATGGTIDKVYFDAKSEYQVGAPGVSEIFRIGGVTAPIEVESILKKDSLELTDADRALIREKILTSPYSHILITHGTDTMTVTAAALQGIPEKVIVLTGAMQPASFRESDAIFNVGFALGALQALAPGVHIAMNGQIFNPLKIKKNIQLNRFELIS